MSDKKILLVDDSPENLELLAVLLERNGWDYATADSGVAALSRLEAGAYDLVITDLMMPAMNGLELLTRVKEKWPGIEVVIVTAYGSIPTAIDAIKKGAYTYILRPFEPEEVVIMINKIFEILDIRSENTLLKEELNRERRYDKMVGKSQAMQRLYKLIDNVAQTSSTALITGESGVGKELIARALHTKSSRAKQPFIKVSCASLPESLLESELFGHEKGSFTGAVATRKGRFELANKGTIFLDEIGEISKATQVKLLRVIQEKEFERIGGGGKTIKTDTRIISATNKNLAREVENGSFREDLYYRLNVITIEAPPLRERKDDLPLLAYHFLERYSAEINKEVTSFSDDTLALIANYNWPGNVRELQNVVERAVVLTRNTALQPEDLPAAIRASGSDIVTSVEEIDFNEALSLRNAKSAWEKRYLERALMKFQGNISRTAAAIDIARKNLQEKIKTHKLDASRFFKK